jgi:hypothetical protein
MADELNDAFVPIRDASGKVTGMMDRATADYLASRAPDPTQASLDALLAGVTRVRVVPFANYRRGGTESVTLLDTADPASLESFRRCFAIDEDPETFGHCMCCGDPHLELYAGDRLAATVGYHHGLAIRWDAWKHDAQLKEPGRLLDWLAARGVDGPRREAERMKERAEESRLQAERWLAATPECLRPFWGEMGNDRDPDLHRRLLDALRAAIPAAEGQALALFAWFGSGAGPWSGYPSYESVPERLILHYPTRFLVAVLTGCEPTEAQWHGAARYFGGWEFRRARKGDRGLLPPGLKQRLLEAARSTGVRDNAERAERAFGG